MRKYVQKQILDLILTVIEGVSYSEKNTQYSTVMLNDCLYALENIKNTMTEQLSTDMFLKYDSLFISVFDSIKTIISNIEENISSELIYVTLKINLDDIKTYLSDEIIKIEILFLPYKMSMWDSMESVWLEAKEDDRCDCYVMPIPYYERNQDLSLKQMHYEGMEFPSYVPITKVSEYIIATRRPDVIYIHNPYDDLNRITTVDSNFYSDKLKMYTDNLVYIPYYIDGPSMSIDASKKFALYCCSIRRDEKTLY